MVNETIEEILAIEWEMFDATQNTGGRASCQEDPGTFRVMRSSQFLAWTEQMRQQYAVDLREAKENGRNLVAEKYAWMMESTYPEEFEKIRVHLTAPSERAAELIELILYEELRWGREVSVRFPKVSGRGRVLTSAEDDAYNTSVETYSRGEKRTYSEKLLELFYEHIEALKRKGLNLQEMILSNTASLYGYTSLEAAETFVQK